MLQEISSVDGIAGYDASIVAMPHYYTQSGESIVTEDNVNSFYTYGSLNSEYNELFTSGRFELVEGSHITEDVSNGLVLSRDRVEKNGLKLGDKVSGINNPYADDPEVEMELVGIFDIVADKNDEANMLDDSTMWDFTDYAFCSINAMKAMAVNYEDGSKIREADFYVSDAAQLENVIAEVQNISSINWDNFIVTANDEVYQNISSALSDTNTLVTTLIVVVTVVSMVLITLILSMSIRSRKKETGILLAVGIAKPAVILQYALETMLIAIVAFPLAYLSSTQVAGAIGTLFGKTAANVIVTPQHFMMVAIVGVVLLLASVMVSCIPAIRLKPKQILSQME